MHAETIAINLLAVVLYLLCAVHIYKFLLAPDIEKSDWKRWRQTCMKQLNRISGRLCCRWRKPRAGIFEKAVKEQMENFRVEQCHNVACGMAHVAAPLMCATGLKQQISAAGEPDPVRFGAFIIFYFLLLLVATRSIKLTGRRLDVVFSSLAVVIIFMLVRMVDDPRYFDAQAIRVVTRQVLCIMYLDFAKSFPWQLLISILEVWRYTSHYSLLYPGEDRLSNLVLQEICFCGWTTLGGYFVQAWLEALFRAQLVAHNQKRAMLKLAAYKCDAVFKLSPDLCLNGPAPQLAHLLSAGDENYLDGEPFTGHIASDSDRERFRTFLANSVAASDPEGLPSLFHMDLQESNGRTLPVEVFHSCFVDDADQIGHFIGICLSSAAAPRQQHDRKEAEQQPAGEMCSESPPAAPALSVVQRTLSKRVVDDIQSVGLTAYAPSTIGDPEPFFVPLLPEEMAPAPVSIMFDASTYTVIGCSVGFATLFGPLLFATRVQDIVTDCTEFVPWLHISSNEFLWGEGQDIAPLEVRVAVPTPTKQKKLELVVDAYFIGIEEAVRSSEWGLDLFAVEVGAEQNEGGEEAVYESVCIIEFRNAEVRRPGQRRTTHRSVATGPSAGTTAKHTVEL